MNAVTKSVTIVSGLADHVGHRVRRTGIITRIELRSKRRIERKREDDLTDADKLLRITKSKYEIVEKLQKQGAFKDLPYKDPQMQKDIMVQAAEAVGNISLDKPHGPGPGLLDFPQRGMTAAPFPETVRPARKLRLVIRLQQEPHHLAGEFI